MILSKYIGYLGINGLQAKMRRVLGINGLQAQLYEKGYQGLQGTLHLSFPVTEINTDKNWWKNHGF